MLWKNIKQQLKSKYPNLDVRISQLNQVPAIMARDQGRRWTDPEIFEALILSILSNSTDWSKVESVRDHLGGCLNQFDISWYANLSADIVKTRIIPWFKSRKAGSLSQSKDLITTILTAGRFVELIRTHGSLERYFSHLYSLSGSDPILLANAIGNNRSPTKLPVLGIPLAAEFLKNIGYDVAKPDRHICRAALSFRWVQFRPNTNFDGKKPALIHDLDKIAVMRAVHQFASIERMRTAYVDNAVWLLCAKSGLNMSNSQLALLAR